MYPRLPDALTPTSARITRFTAKGIVNKPVKNQPLNNRVARCSNNININKTAVYSFASITEVVRTEGASFYTRNFAVKF